MTGAVHACIGACLGCLLKKKSDGFAAGVVSHAVADALPHKDFHPAIEVALMAAALYGIAKWRGVDSPELWGAVGAVAPDAEHGLMLAGIITPEQEVFPTHIENGKLHGAESNERWSQLIIAGTSLLIMTLKD